MIVAFTFGSPAATVAAVGTVLIALMAFGRGSVAAFGFQRTKIDELLQKIADLEKADATKSTRITELERIVAATQLLPTAGFQPVLEAFASHELRAAERHAELQAEHRKLIRLADGSLKILGDLAAHHGPEPDSPA